MIAPEKIAAYGAMLVFVYLSWYVTRDVLKKNTSLIYGLFFALLCPLVVFALVSVTGLPIDPELIIAVAISNILYAVYAVYKEKSTD